MLRAQTTVKKGAAVPLAAPYPSSGRRLVVYVVWDRRGEVEDYVPFALSGFRDQAAHILVVVNGSLSDEGRAKLEPVVDEILVRDNLGFDIWAHKDALTHLGPRLTEFDELLMTNDTWFGPVRDFAPVFERMAIQQLHFWGMTDHAREEPNPFTHRGVLAYHLQSFWIAVRKEMFLSPQWSDYWRDLPQMPGYFDAVLKHETIFTEHFATRGFRHGVAFASDDYPTDHPALFNADLLLADGCPVVKRRPFFHYPPFLDRHAVIGRDLVREIEGYGYPIELLWRNLARTVPPKTLNTDAGMLEVLPDVDVSYDAEHPLRTVAVAHIFHVSMTAEILDRFDALPGPFDLIITTPDDGRRTAIQAAVDESGTRAENVEIRVVESNDGRDQSAFLIGCRDVLISGDYDLVVKLHSKKTPQDGFNIGRHFKTQQFTNLLNSPGYAANVIALFQRESGLGLAYPPMIHVGYPTMGRAWWSNKPAFTELCAKLGIKVPLDDVSPLAPFGSMYFARPQALRLLVDHPWKYADFGGAEAYRDGGLAHVLERMPSYAAGELGYHTRTIATTDYMSVSHTSLEFKLDEVSATLPGDTVDAIQFLRGGGSAHGAGLIDLARVYVAARHPRVGTVVRRTVGRSSRLGRALSRLRRR